MTTYNKTAVSELIIEQLQAEIAADTNILISCVAITFDSESLALVLEFASDLSVDEETALDNIISNHVMNATPVVQNSKWKEIQTERDRRKAAGIKVDTKWYHSDDTSRIQYLGLAMYGANMPTGIMWKTMDGTFIEMTPTLVQQISGTIGSNDVAIFSVAEQHRGAMLASQDPESYNMFNGNPAWPLVYGEE